MSDNLEKTPIKDKMETIENNEIDTENPSELLRPAKTSVYINKEEQYNELKSSAIIFIIVSILGAAFLVVNIVGLVSFINGSFSYIILSVMFLALFFMGLSTLKNAKEVEIEIETEKDKTTSINKWLLKNVSKENMNDLLDYETIQNDEIFFLNITEKMKDLINQEFGQQDDNYLDRLVEEYYNDYLE